MTQYIENMKFSAFFLLACGAVVKEGAALSGLQTISERYGCPALVYSFLTYFAA
jgi:hypothetical protein